MPDPIDYRLSGRYWGFSADTPDERIIELFEHRFGKPPEILRQPDNCIVLCKIPQGEHNGNKSV